MVKRQSELDIVLALVATVCPTLTDKPSAKQAAEFI